GRTGEGQLKQVSSASCPANFPGSSNPAAAVARVDFQPCACFNVPRSWLWPTPPYTHADFLAQIRVDSFSAMAGLWDDVAARLPLRSVAGRGTQRFGNRNSCPRVFFPVVRRLLGRVE